MGHKEYRQLRSAQLGTQNEGPDPNDTNLRMNWFPEQFLVTAGILQCRPCPRLKQNYRSVPLWSFVLCPFKVSPDCLAGLQSP